MVGYRSFSGGIAIGALVIACACGGSDHDPGSQASGGVAGSLGSPGVAGNSGLGAAATKGGTSGASSGGSSGAGASGGVSGAASSGGASGADVGGAAGSNEVGAAGAAGAEGDLVAIGSVPADKIDLLFVIDDSISMLDKQQIFKSAVPLLVRRLVTPVCVDAAGTPNGQHAATNGICAQGEPEFPPIRDIHVGVITSSLGAPGGQTCSQPGQDDKARLLPKIRTDLRSWNSSGFLAWDPEGTRNTPGGESNPDVLVTDFANMVVAAGESGCGFEAPLEAWYRFLVDPDPPSAVTARADLSGVDVTYPDAALLEQRKAFLRPDSLVGIVVLSDENDCSIGDSGQSFLVGFQVNGGQTFHMPRATSACVTDPNDSCCTSCSAPAASGCTPHDQDVECMKSFAYTQREDQLNLRCYEQKRRFGVDLLQPVQRYVDGLTESAVVNRAGQPVPNPLLQAPAGSLPRDRSKIFLLQIVGVPWQDIADAASLSDPRRLRYLSHAELVAENRWDLILGDTLDPPRDALMLETSQDRSTLGLGPHPITGAVLAPPSSTSPQQNPINGHESLIDDASDLQYACIFPLATPRDCSAVSNTSCDCDAAGQQYSRALCRHPAGGPSTYSQYFAKAYPGLRQIELARAFGAITENSALASICPKVMDSSMPSTDANYGYNPAITALVDRMKNQLAPACLSEPLDANAQGQVSCKLLEVAMTSSACSCAGSGRTTPSATLAGALRNRLSVARYCGDFGQPSCNSLCVCEIEQVPSASLAACQYEAAVPVEAAGFCYLDQALGIGNPSLLQHCPVDRRRRLRFVGADVPQRTANTYLFCP